jgi:hypothetical protein
MPQKNASKSIAWFAELGNLYQSAGRANQHQTSWWLKKKGRMREMFRVEYSRRGASWLAVRAAVEGEN